MKETNVSGSKKIYVLDGASGGTAFTVATIIPVIVSFIWIVAFAAIGKNLADYEGQSWYVFCSYAVSSVALFVACAFIMFKSKLDVRAGAGLFRFQPKFLWIIALISFGTLFGLSWINDEFITFLQKLGYKASEMTVPKDGAVDFILCTVIICILPALFEETLFRGIILNGSRYLGEAFCVIMGGFLFSIYHKNPMQTPYQFITGALFALVAIKSGSVIPCIIMHFVNNFYIIIYYFAVPESYVMPLALKLSLCAAGLIALAFAVWYMLKKCGKSQQEIDFEKQYAKAFDLRAERKQFVLFALFGILVCAAIWIVNLISAV